MIQTELDTGWRFSCRSWLKPPGTLGYSRYEWLPASVPGHVHLDLIKSGVITNPFVELQEIACQWIDAEDWVYVTEFSFEPRAHLPRRVLRFEGLDTICSIALNGIVLGRHDNMFTPLELDVSAYLQEGANRLEVRFESVTRVGEMRRQAFFQREDLASDIVRFDERAFVRKAAYMFGWDWGPRLVSAGIWKPVRLLEFAARIVDVKVTQTHLSDGSVRVHCAAQTEGTGRVVHYLRFQEERPVRIEDDASCLLTQPEVWWPLGMGEQPLYELETLLLSSCTEHSATEQQQLPHESQVLHRQVTRVGLRRLALVKEKDEFGESFRFEVNGRRMWCLGANWIPAHSFPSCVTRSRLREHLARAADMQMNMLRVWGGGLYESDDFYDTCDELGILVWQDFPFACSYAPDDQDAQQVMLVESAANVRRLRNHPSLAVWCGNNENLQMFHNKWDDSSKHPPRYYGERLWHETLPLVLAELDPARPYLPTSPHLGANPNADECGDQHNWDVWHGRGDWCFYSDSKARFPSEYGFASAPCRSAWEAMFSERADWARYEVHHPVARWHDKTKKGHETFVGFVELHYPHASDLRQWTYTSQLNQRDALRHAIEHYRRSRFAAGSLIWQLNDCWPAQSWSVMDSTGAYKAAAFELRRLHAPLLAAVELVGAGPGVRGVSTTPLARIWAIHDNSPSALRDELCVELRDSVTGEIVQKWCESIELEPSQRKCAVELTLSNSALNRTLLWVTFGGFQSVRSLCEPKQTQWHSALWQACRNAEGILLRSDGPATDVFVEPIGVGAASDLNLVSLPEAGTVALPALGGVERLAITTLAGTVEIDIE